jgi:hypothetical protein
LISSPGTGAERFGDKNKEETFVFWILGKVLFGQFMFTFSWFAVDYGHSILFGPSMHTAAKPPGHVLQFLGVNNM